MARELPPARSSRPPARPSLSSSNTFSMCRGENCWWPSRIASDCADWIKPRARSVYFSIFIAISLSLPLRPEGTDTASSLGFRAAVLTFLNQPAGLSPALHRLGPNVGSGFAKRKRRLHKFVCGGEDPRDLSPQAGRG